MKVFSETAKNESFIRDYYGGSFDATLRSLRMADGRAALVFQFDGLVNKMYIEDAIVRPLMGMTCRQERGRVYDVEAVKSTLVLGLDVKQTDELLSVLALCSCGDTAVFIDGFDQALVVQTRGWATRGISGPETDRSVRGPREAFGETMLLNATMLRRKIKSNRLVFEVLRIGELSKTDVCLAYVKGIAEDDLINRVRERISGVDVKYILESGHIEQLIEDSRRSVFATVGNTEKPDAAAEKLMKGRVAVLVDGTPFALTIPMVFTENFQTTEDYYSRPYYANIVRLLRVLAYVITICLPGLYVALVTYHQEMIPAKLLAMMIRASEGTVFSATLEMVIMLILYELLREALLRLPVPLGATVGIIGSFVIGDAAVSAGIIGAPVVVVVALTFICSAVVNSCAGSTAVLRLILLAGGAIFGLYGVLLAIFGTVAHMCSLKSFGTPYMMPLSPVKTRGLGDSLVRGRIENILGGRGKS